MGGTRGGHAGADRRSGLTGAPEAEPVGMITAGRTIGTANWCHMCGKWREVTGPAYLCLVCIEKWSATYTARTDPDKRW